MPVELHREVYARTDRGHCYQSETSRVYREDVFELNSIKSPTARKILFKEDSSDDSTAPGPVCAFGVDIALVKQRRRTTPITSVA